jgi:hypothetical protein
MLKVLTITLRCARLPRATVEDTLNREPKGKETWSRNSQAKGLPLAEPLERPLHEATEGVSPSNN